jgi:hypothetical protein
VGLAFAAGVIARHAAQQCSIKDLLVRLDQLEQQLTPQRLALPHQQRMHWELLQRAIDDPSLAAVLDTYDTEIPPEKQRQFLYANAWYVNAFNAYRTGTVSREELYGYLRGLFQSRLIREYWHANRNHRATLKETSEEAELGRVVDDLISDLEEADTDEWWVIGEPPTP